MTDLNKTLLEKASGACRFDPDQQKKFLETFEERVIACCSVREANAPLYQDHFREIAQSISENFSPVFVKISPNVDEKAQLTYLKISKELGLSASIVSDDCAASPFGIIFHTDHPSDVLQTDMKEAYPQFFNTVEETSTKAAKPSFWKKLFR